MKNTFLFLDLDDTIFQTKRKNINGIIQATNPQNPENTSYMTNYQKLFLDIFFSMDNVKVIPVTARDIEQYNRTFLSTHPKVSNAAMYFSGVIFEDNKIDETWQKHIKGLYSDMNFPIIKMFERLKENIDPENFKIFNADGFYVYIKNKEKENYKNLNEKLIKELPQFIEDDYFIHSNANNISFMPKFLDKKFAVDYLIEKYQPELTIGAGDSLTDLSFMQQCDFRIIPRNSQIEKNLFSSLIEK